MTGQDLYWVEAAGFLLKANLRDGQTATLAAADNTIPLVAASSAGVFWFADGLLMHLPPAGTATPLAALGADRPRCLAADETSVYYGGSSAIRRFDVFTGEARFFSSGYCSKDNLQVDATHLYWTASNAWVASIVVALPKDGGGDVVTLLPSSADGYRVRGRRLFWKSGKEVGWRDLPW